MKNTKRMLLVGMAATAIMGTSVVGFAATANNKGIQLAEANRPKASQDQYYGGRGCGGYGRMRAYGSDTYTEEEWAKIREERQAYCDENGYGRMGGRGHHGMGFGYGGRQ